MLRSRIALTTHPKGRPTHTGKSRPVSRFKSQKNGQLKHYLFLLHLYFIQIKVDYGFLCLAFTTKNSRFQTFMPMFLLRSGSATALPGFFVKLTVVASPTLTWGGCKGFNGDVRFNVLPKRTAWRSDHDEFHQRIILYVSTASSSN